MRKERYGGEARRRSHVPKALLASTLRRRRVLAEGARGDDEGPAINRFAVSVIIVFGGKRSLELATSCSTYMATLLAHGVGQARLRHGGSEEAQASTMLASLNMEGFVQKSIALLVLARTADCCSLAGLMHPFHTPCDVAWSMALYGRFV